MPLGAAVVVSCDEENGWYPDASWPGSSDDESLTCGAMGKYSPRTLGCYSQSIPVSSDRYSFTRVMWTCMHACMHLSVWTTALQRLAWGCPATVTGQLWGR